MNCGIKFKFKCSKLNISLMVYLVIAGGLVFIWKFKLLLF